MRRRVDFPQPEGPTMVTSSPISGASSTTKETSWMATLAACAGPKLLQTFLKTTTSGRAAGSALGAAGCGSDVAAGPPEWALAGARPSTGSGFLETDSDMRELLVLAIGEEQLATQTPKLVAGHRNQNNDDDDGVNGFGV